LTPRSFIRCPLSAKPVSGEPAHPEGRRHAVDHAPAAHQPGLQRVEVRVLDGPQPWAPHHHIGGGAAGAPDDPAPRIAHDRDDARAAAGDVGLDVHARAAAGVLALEAGRRDEHAVARDVDAVRDDEVHVPVDAAAGIPARARDLVAHLHGEHVRRAAVGVGV